MQERIGLIAGGESFPLLLARAARQMGVKEIVAISFAGQTSPEIEDVVDKNFWLDVGQFGKLLKTLKANGVTEAVMVGRINPSLVLKNIKFDLKGLATLKKIKDSRADSIFGVVAGELNKAGVKLLDSTLYLKPLLPPPGPLSRRRPTRPEEEDIKFGWRMAKGIAGLDIGQTVIVKKKAVVAIEAIEGTDRTILRGGELGGPGTVVVKVSKPRQDMRFDVPVIGLETLDVMKEAGATVLAIEAHKTLFLDRAAAVEKADRFGIAVMALQDART